MLKQELFFAYKIYDNPHLSLISFLMRNSKDVKDFGWRMLKIKEMMEKEVYSSSWSF